MWIFVWGTCNFFCLKREKNEISQHQATLFKPLLFDVLLSCMLTHNFATLLYTEPPPQKKIELNSSQMLPFTGKCI